MYPIGTEDGRPPQVVFIGHHEGIRGIAGGNWAYIAQSYGASIHEIAMAEMRHEQQWVRPPLRQLR